MKFNVPFAKKRALRNLYLIQIFSLNAQCQHIGKKNSNYGKRYEKLA